MEECLRICFVSFMFSPSVGGAQVRAEKQARQLQALGHDVRVVTMQLDRRWEKTIVLDGLPVVRIGGIYRRDGSLRIGRLGIWPICIGVFLTLWKLRHSYDVIHAFQITPLAAVTTLIGKLTHKPVIISCQSTGPNEKCGSDINYLLQTAIGGQAILSFLRRSNAFYQALSTRNHSYLISQGFRFEQIVHIPGSVDTGKFQPASDRRPDPARPERDIICVARLDYTKGSDVLLHAWGRMMHDSTKWRTQLKPRLRLVGDGELKPQLERIAAELDIQDSVEFLGLRRDIVDLLQQSWGFILPSRWEGMPNALLEAMACGLPCIATRVSGSEDIISDGVNGLLVEPEQPAEMAWALRRLIEDINLAQRLGQEGRATVVREYQLIHIVEQCLELYRYLLTRDKNEKDEASLRYVPLALKGEKR